MSYTVICPNCGKEIDLWEISLHLEQCKEKEPEKDDN